METILLVVVVAILVTVVVVMLVKKFKKKPSPTPTPIPTQKPPIYLGFLSNVEAVIRNNLSEDELKTYFASVKGEYEKYKNEHGFYLAWNTLLSKYNVPNPY